MTTYKFVRVLIKRTDDDNYRIAGLPPGRDFQKNVSYEELSASWLKLNGVGFFCSQAELSEHETIIRVKQDEPGGSARIEWDS